jgi:hypothetical protein
MSQQARNNPDSEENRKETRRNNAEIKRLQMEKEQLNCPHDWSDGEWCPYCGKNIGQD